MRNCLTGLYSPTMVIDAIKTGISVRRGEKRDAVIVIPTTVVTKDNVKEFIDSNNTIY